MGYPGSFPEKVQWIIQVMVDKDGALTEENRSLEAAKKRVGELEKALKESQDYHRKTEVNLNNKHGENLYLYKDLFKSLHEIFFCRGSF